MRTLGLSIAALLATGCTFDEHLPQVDVTGTLILPKEAATYTVLNAQTGEETVVEDIRAIGPVYMGVFPNIEYSLYDYPHPEMGPVIVDGTPGNTYPYGGGTVGRFDFACFSDLACRISTGRFSSFEDILDWYNDVLSDPVKDEFGAVVDSPDFFRSYCYELFQYTADYELTFLSEFVNANGEETNTLDFAVNANGDYEAEFDLWQVTYKPDMKIWGWMDTPSEKFSFSTCDPDQGQYNSKYTNDFYYGTNFNDLLNFPSKYIFENDWVIQDPYAFTATDADAFRLENPEVVVRMDFKNGSDTISEEGE
jgi:hypothetical protein